MSNKNLTTAKSAQNNEFYTRLEDIENELRHYKDHFADKTVFCNCDDPKSSNFWTYFSLNFDFFKLKRLIATHYAQENTSYMLDMYRDSGGVHTTISDLRGNGDFRSEECIELLKQSDIVVTNPPFSLFREYVAQLMEYGKKFVIIGNINAVTYKEFFPLIQQNIVWAGFSFNKTMEFVMPEDYQLKNKGFVDSEGKKHGFVPGIAWYTNLDIKKRHERLELYATYNPKDYPKYDNYDAINVDKVAEMPVDYCESWGVTNDIFNKLNHNEWELVRKQTLDDGVVLNFIIPAKDTYQRELLAKHERGYKEIIESSLTNAIYCSGYMGVPITFLDNYAPEQFNIINANDINQMMMLQLSRMV